MSSEEELFKTVKKNVAKNQETATSLKQVERFKISKNRNFCLIFLIIFPHVTITYCFEGGGTE